ncbi:MAG: hypothetical protein CMG41_04245 [Candidatus Marinimicrobia bacterium]|nr:hypothetical protein [Candidatus Neomarinimicrobiota bacterium]
MIKSIVCFISIISFSFAIDNDGDSLVMEGVRSFYNYEFDKSIDILNEARLQYPDHPGVHFIWSSSKYYISQGIDPVHATYDTLDKVLNQIEPIYKRFIEKEPSNNEYKLYLGSTRGLKARSSLGNKDWISVLVEAYRGFSVIEKVAEEDPELIDAQLPIGIVEYYASVSNIFIRWAVNLYGLESSKEMALEKIANAAKNSKWAWIEASGIISFIYLWLEDMPHEAIPYARRLSNEFPNNFYFNILYLESLIKTNMIADARSLTKQLDKKFEPLTRRQKDWYGPYLDYEKALLLFYENNYLKALPLIDEAIDNYSGELDIILGNLFLLKAKALDIQGNRSEAVKYYNKCVDLNNFSSAIEESDKYLSVPYKGKRISE